jgi:hypothetical protein
MPETMSGEHFVNIAEELHPKLHTGVQYQNDFQAEGAIGNQGSPAEEETGAGKSYEGVVERAGYPTQGPEREGQKRPEKSTTSEPNNYEN